MPNYKVSFKNTDDVVKQIRKKINQVLVFHQQKMKTHMAQVQGGDETLTVMYQQG
jgi:hypothetical protein